MHPQLEKLLNLDLLSYSNRMVFQLEETEGIKERESYNLKLVMRLPDCFECIQDSYSSECMGLMDLLYVSMGITHRAENGRNIKRLKMVKYHVSQKTNTEDSRNILVTLSLILGKIQDKRW